MVASPRHSTAALDFTHAGARPNTANKSGNIREWITTYGAAYRYFVIFDADSMMTAQALMAMVAAMEREPGLGLLQSVPRLVGSETIFARAQQFAAAYY